MTKEPTTYKLEYLKLAFYRFNTAADEEGERKAVADVTAISKGMNVKDMRAAFKAAQQMVAGDLNDTLD